MTYTATHCDKEKGELLPFTLTYAASVSCWYLFVFDAVNDGVDTTVDKHHDDSKVVEHAREVDQRVVQVEHQVVTNTGNAIITIRCARCLEHQVVGLVPGPTEDEEESDRRERLDDVWSCPSHALVSLRFFAFTRNFDVINDHPNKSRMRVMVTVKVLMAAAPYWMS